MSVRVVPPSIKGVTMGGSGSHFYNVGFKTDFDTSVTAYRSIGFSKTSMLGVIIVTRPTDFLPEFHLNPRDRRCISPIYNGRMASEDITAKQPSCQNFWVGCQKFIRIVWISQARVNTYRWVYYKQG